MRIVKKMTKLGYSYYIIEDIYKDGKKTTKTVELLGTGREICEKHNISNEQPYLEKRLEYHRAKKEKGLSRDISFKPNTVASERNRQLVSAATAYLIPIYKALRLDEIAAAIQNKYQLDFCLNDVLTSLVMQGILESNKHNKTCPVDLKYLGVEEYSLDNFYETIKILNTESENIQRMIFDDNRNFVNLDTIHYDCANFNFNFNNKDGSFNKDINMGIFLDENGIPIFYKLYKRPTDSLSFKDILEGINTKQFVMLCDQGLAEIDEMDEGVINKSYVRNISSTKLRDREIHLNLNHNSWSLLGSDKKYNIKNLLDSFEDNEQIKNHPLYEKIFFKVIKKENGKHLYITYSLKYALNKAVEKQKIIKKAFSITKDANNINKYNESEVLKLIESPKIAFEKSNYMINIHELLTLLEQDNFYIVQTNIDDIEKVIQIVKQRFEMQDSFNVMQNKIKILPHFIDSLEAINAHVLIHFLAMTIYRHFEKIVNIDYTNYKIIDELSKINLLSLSNEFFIPAYTNSALTTNLYKKFGYRIDYELLSVNRIKKMMNSKHFIKHLKKIDN